MNELTSSRVANDVVSRRAQTELLTNLIKQTLDHTESPHPLGLEMPRLVRHVPKSITVARIVPLSKLGDEEHEVVVLREGGADIAGLFAGATTAVHQE